MRIEEILLSVTRYFEENKITYAIVGGFSAAIWGRVRTTYDIDIIVDHSLIQTKDLVNFFKTNGLHTTQYDLEQAFKERSHATIFLHANPLYRIDLTGVYSASDKETISTARTVRFKGQNIQFGAPECLIAHKLKFGSERDLEDALVVYLAQRDKLEIEWLKTLCNQLGVGEQLKFLVKKAED